MWMVVVDDVFKNYQSSTIGLHEILYTNLINKT
jgi:hypothetical protein